MEAAADDDDACPQDRVNTSAVLGGSMLFPMTRLTVELRSAGRVVDRTYEGARGGEDDVCCACACAATPRLKEALLH